MRRLPHDRRLQLLALLGGTPALLVASIFIFRTPGSLAWKLPLVAVIFLSWWFAAQTLQTRAIQPLQTLLNLLGALREGDFSFRARHPREGDALGEVYLELNTLSDLLQHQRIRTLEATAILRGVMAEIDVAIFAFDEDEILRLVNRAGEVLLGQPQERILGQSATTLKLQETLLGEETRLLDLPFPGRPGRYELRRSAFRQGGRPHHLMVLSDLTRPLREEERKAWHRLIRVLGHEINNSLAPIHSLSESLVRIIETQEEGWLEDAKQGLGIIASRAQSLRRFMEAYTRLARLPEPRKTAVALGPLVRKVIGLEQQKIVILQGGPELILQADGDQLEQVLINLLRNAVDACAETGGGVTILWREAQSGLEFLVEDEGSGLPTGGNLFVPFFTTKPTGSGIGLVLSRQIAEAHGGSLVLANREDGAGARAILRLPIGP